MQRCSESIGAIAGALASQGPDRARQPREVADRNHPLALPPRERPQLPLPALIQRVRPGAGDELTWQQLNVEPLGMALQLWQRTRPDGGRAPRQVGPKLKLRVEL
jgi:hypothetical protein